MGSVPSVSLFSRELLVFQPGNKILQHLAVVNWRAVAETDDGRFQFREDPDRAKVLPGIHAEPVGRDPQADRAAYKMDVGQHIASDRQAIGVAKVDDVTGGMTRRVNDAETSHLIAFTQHPADGTWRSGPDPVREPDETIRRLHGYAPFHGADIRLVTGERNSKPGADVPGRPLVIGMTMS